MRRLAQWCSLVLPASEVAVEGVAANADLNLCEVLGLEACLPR